MRPSRISFLFAFLLAALAGTPVAHAVCPANNALSTPTADFTLNGDGTVTHLKTGLMWKQCMEGRSGATCATGSATTMTWSAALSAAATPFAGHSDWRLPNQKELQSIVEAGCYSPSINETAFPNTISNYFWSSTAYASSPAYAWYVYFVNGYSGAGGKTGSYYVRLVRGGQSFDSFDAQNAHKASQTISFGAVPAVITGGMGTASATATSGLAVSFSSTTPGKCTVSGSTVTGVAAGTCTIAANQAGDASYSAAAQVTQNITIGISRSDCIFNWAERTYPAYFSPAAPSATYPPYYYRYYSGTGNYLATSSADNNLYVLGAATGWSLRNVGPVTGFLGVSGCP